MHHVEEVIAAIESATEPSRRLDALATAWAVAPKNWSLDAFEDIDGWAINCSTDGEKEAQVWMCSADVGYVTRYMDAAMELVEATRPEDAGVISARAFARLLSVGGVTGNFSQRAACQMVAELLRSLYVIDERSDIALVA